MDETRWEVFVKVEGKAANWQCLGLTKGRDKLEITGQPALPVKWVFVYPLCADFIARLNG